MKATKQYSENFHGVLTHDGWVRVAKSNITAKIVNIYRDNIRVKQFNTTKNKMVQYNCIVHKNLRQDIKYLAVNDTVSVKFNCGRPYIVGYRKADAKDDTTQDNGDRAVSENMDWITFFEEMDLEC